MSDNSSSSIPVPPAKKEPNCKICCACPSERRMRDECVIFNGFEKCQEHIDKFYACLLNEGFSQDQVDSLRNKAILAQDQDEEPPQLDKRDFHQPEGGSPSASTIRETLSYFKQEMQQRLQEGQSRSEIVSDLKSEQQEQRSKRRERKARQQQLLEKRGRQRRETLAQQSAEKNQMPPHLELLEALQKNAPPGIRFAAPNLLLPSPVTHIVEFEFVKAWRSVLAERSEPLPHPATVSDPEERRKLKEKQHANFAHDVLHRRVANVTNWEVLGSVLIALFGDAEPELVRKFVSSTRRAYRGRTLQDSFYGVHPMSKASDDPDQKHRLYAGQFVSAESLPLELRHGFEFPASNEAATTTVRPPWAQRHGQRWVCSTVQRPALAHFSLFDGSEKKAEWNRRFSSSKSQSELEQQQKEQKRDSICDDEKDDDENADNDKKHHRGLDRDRGPDRAKLLLRIGSLLHRNCAADEKSNNDNDGTDDSEPGSAPQKQQAGAPFTWYVTGGRNTAALLRTHELADQAENNETSTAEFRRRIRELHGMCRGDRIFGQVISGYPHIDRLLKLPQHRQIFARDHFVNRTKTRVEMLKSISKNSKSESRSDVVEESTDSSSTIPPLFHDDHTEELWSPFLEGVPMQHISISRATVTEFRGIDSFIDTRNIAPHAQPPRDVEAILAMMKEQQQQTVSSDEELSELKKQRLRELEETHKLAWAKYGFGRALSPFDLDADVRFTRAQVARRCARERAAARVEFDELLEFAATLSLNESVSDDSDEQPKHRLAHLLHAVGNNNSNGNKNRTLLSNDEELFDRFLRFTGGSPIGPNITTVAAIWNWADKNYHSLTQAAMLDRIAGHAELKRHHETRLRNERKKKMAMRRAAGLTHAKLKPDNNKNNNNGDDGDGDKHSMTRILLAQQQEQRKMRERELEKLQELNRRGVINAQELEQELQEVEEKFHKSLLRLRAQTLVAKREEQEGDDGIDDDGDATAADNNGGIRKPSRRDFELMGRYAKVRRDHGRFVDDANVDDEQEQVIGKEASIKQ